MMDNINLGLYGMLALNVFLTLSIGYLVTKKKYKISVMLGLLEVFLAIITYYLWGM